MWFRSASWSLLCTTFVDLLITTSPGNMFHTVTKPNADRRHVSVWPPPETNSRNCRSCLTSKLRVPKPVLRFTGTKSFANSEGAVPEVIRCNIPIIAMARLAQRGASRYSVKARSSESPTSLRNLRCTLSTHSRTEGAAWCNAGVPDSM